MIHLRHIETSHQATVVAVASLMTSNVRYISDDVKLGIRVYHQTVASQAGARIGTELGIYNCIIKL